MKTINKTMSNAEIYSYAIGLINNFKDDDTYLPAAVAFSIQKNKAAISSIAEDIEKNRMKIIQHYGTPSEDNVENYMIAPESIEIVNKELEDLLSIEQDMKIYTFDIGALADVKLTTAQIQAIMFMIQEDEGSET